MTQADFSNPVFASWQNIFTDVFSVTITESADDIASLVDAAGVSLSCTVAGVALGDMVLGVSFGVSTVGMLVTANVTAANTVIIRIQNETAASPGTTDLADTTIRLLIGRPNPELFRAAVN